MIGRFYMDMDIALSVDVHIETLTYCMIHHNEKAQRVFIFHL